MFRLVVAASVGALLMTLLTAMPSQFFSTPQRPLAQPMVVYQQVPQRPVTLARAGAPQMVVGVPETLASLQTIDATSVLLAKSQADEFLEDFLISFPVLVCGTVVGYAALQFALSTFEAELPEGKENIVIAVACLGGSVFLLGLSNAGVLTGAAGIFAKLLLDGWNVIANAVLKGAILKY